MHYIFQTVASTLADPTSGNEGESAEDEPDSQQDDVSSDHNDEDKVNNTQDDNESNYEGSVNENPEADISQIPTDSLDQVADYSDDQDSTFTPKPSDLKSLDGSDLTTDEDLQQEVLKNPTDESDVSTDFDGVILTSVATDIAKKSASSSNTKKKRTPTSSKKTLPESDEDSELRLARDALHTQTLSPLPGTILRYKSDISTDYSPGGRPNDSVEQNTSQNTSNVDIPSTSAATSSLVEPPETQMSQSILQQSRPRIPRVKNTKQTKVPIPSQDTPSGSKSTPRKQYNMRRSTKDWGSIAESQFSKTSAINSPAKSVGSKSSKSTGSRSKKSSTTPSLAKTSKDIPDDCVSQGKKQTTQVKRKHDIAFPPKKDVVSVSHTKRHFIPESEEKQDEIDVTTDSDSVIGPSPPPPTKKKRNAKEILKVKITPQKKTNTSIHNIPSAKKDGKGVKPQKTTVKPSTSKTDKEMSAEDKMIQIQQQKLQLMSDYYKKVDSGTKKDTTPTIIKKTVVPATQQEEDSSESVMHLWSRMHLKKMKQIKSEEVRDQLMEHVTHVTNLAIRGKWPTDSDSVDIEIRPHTSRSSHMGTSTTFRRPQTVVDVDSSERVNESSISAHSTPKTRAYVAPQTYPADTPLVYYPGYMPRPKSMLPSTVPFLNTSQPMQFANAQTGELTSPILSREIQEQIASLIARSPMNPVYCHNYNQYGSANANAIETEIPTPQLHPNPTRMLDNPNMCRPSQIMVGNPSAHGDINVRPISKNFPATVSTSRSVTPSSQVSTGKEVKDNDNVPLDDCK